MAFEYSPIEGEGTILKRVKTFLETTQYNTVLVSSGLPQAIPEEMVWLTLEDGSTISEGYQAILVRVKTLANSWLEAEKMALKVRSFIESEEFLLEPIFRVDGVSRPRRSEELAGKKKSIFLFNFTIYQLANNL